MAVKIEILDYVYTDATNTVIDWEKSIVGELDVTNHSDFPLALTFQISDIKDLTSTSGDYSKTFKIPATKHNNQLLKNIYTSGVITDNKVTENKKCRILVNNLYSLLGLIQVTGDGGYGEKAAYYNCVFFGSNLNWADDLSGKYMNDIDWGADGEDLTYNKTSIMATWDDTDCTTSSSYIVYPITSYGDYNGGGDGIDRTIQLLDTWSDAGNHASSYSGYFGFKDDGTSYGTPPPVPDWRPSVFVKDTLDKIFDGAGDGYKISSTFMDTPMFKKLVWLLPNFKYNNIEERFDLYSTLTDWTNNRTLSIPSTAYLDGYSDSGIIRIFNGSLSENNGDYYYTGDGVVLLDLDDATSDPSSYNISVDSDDSSNLDFATSVIDIAEYGYYDIDLTGLEMKLARAYKGGTIDRWISYIWGTVNVEVQTVGQTSWNILERTFYKFGVHQDVDRNTAAPTNAYDSTVGWASLDNVIIKNQYLNKGDKIRLSTGLKIDANTSSQNFFVYIFVRSTGSSSNLNIKFKPEIVDYGQTYNLTDVVNPEYKQIDFIKGIAHAFNLKMTTDEVTRTISIEPFDSFYLPYGDAIDWTYKLDRSKEISDAWLKTDLKRNLVFKYKTDSEDKNVENRGNVLFDKVLDECPYKETLPKTFEKGDSVFENPFFAGTFNSKDQDTVRYAPVDTAYSACLWTEITSSDDWGRPNKGFDFLPRLLYWNKYSPDSSASNDKTASVQTWATNGAALSNKQIVANGALTVQNSILSNIYPQATMVDRDKTASPVLSYGNIWVRDYDDLTGTYASPVVGEGLYHTYHKNMIEMLKQNPRLRTIYIDLKINDIINLDFRKLVYIDGVYWRINKVLDYQPNNNQATKVELMEWFQLGIFAANAPAITTFVGGIGVNVGGGIIDDSNNNMGL